MTPNLANTLEPLLLFGSKMIVFLAGLAALIFVHELGHFLAARRVGVVVEKFSLGFGKKIFGWTSGGTEYLISAIPLGGYVKMKGEELGEETPEEGSFSAASVRHRLEIAFAGPLFNIIFAILIYIGVYMVGVPTMSTLVGEVRNDSPAQLAGLKTGDRIVEIDGDPIRYWDQLLEIVHHNPGKQMEFLIEKDSNRVVSVPITPVTDKVTNMFGEEESVGLIGISPLVRNIAYVEKDSAADKAGIKVGDTLISMNGRPVFGWKVISEEAIQKPGQKVELVIRRDNTDMKFELVPTPKKIKDKEDKEQEIGDPGFYVNGEMLDEKYGFFGSIQRSFQETWHLISLIGISIKKMVVGTVPADSIGGPILIFQIYGKQAEQGFFEVARLTALLSINLGLLNLLPIPMLDGGHILFFLIEGIRGRPLNEKSRELAQQVGLFMLISLMVFAFYNDIMRIVTGS